MTSLGKMLFSKTADSIKKKRQIYLSQILRNVPMIFFPTKSYDFFRMLKLVSHGEFRKSDFTFRISDSEKEHIQNFKKIY